MRPDEEKVRLRREVLAAREGIPEDERVRSSETMFARVRGLPEYLRARTVLAYCSFGTEPDTKKFLRDTLDGGRRLVLPRINPDTKTLVLHEVRDLNADLVPGVWGILEPEAGLPEVSIEEIDFVLVPGVAFDRDGGRLGYGGGYYDRMLGASTKLPMLVAAAFDVQIVEKVPVEAHDIGVGVISTELQSLRTTHTRNPDTRDKQG